MMFPSRSTRYLLDSISVAWVNVFGGAKFLTSDGEIGMRSKDVDDRAVCDQII